MSWCSVISPPSWLRAVENAVVVGGLGALGAALYSLGVPKDSVLSYESDLKADGFLVMARGTQAEVERAEARLAAQNPVRKGTHLASEEPIPSSRLTPWRRGHPAFGASGGF